MSFLKRSKASSSSTYAQLLSENEQGDLARARLTLRELASIVDEGYIDLVLQQLQQQVADLRLLS